MSFENTAGLGVSNHFGPRNQKGTIGSEVAHDGRTIYSINAEGPYPSELEVIIKAGSVVESVTAMGTSAVTTLVVGAQDISAATNAAPVKVTTTGALAGTFTGSGVVLVTVLSAA